MEEMDIGGGIRQVCSLSPTMFNIYAEEITKKTSEKEEELQQGGEGIYTIKHTNDQVVLAESEKIYYL